MTRRSRRSSTAPRRLGRLRSAITRCAARRTPEVTTAPWWREDWIDAHRQSMPAPRSSRPWTDGAACTAKRSANSTPPTRSSRDRRLRAGARRGARGQIIEARAALDLLQAARSTTSTKATSTPTATLPPKASCPATRSPGCRSSAFIPADRRTTNGQGDYVQRPRFLAISEFGPGAFIYHEGARYEVDRVSLPARDDGAGVNITEIKRCDACGYLHESNGATSYEICEHCGSGIPGNTEPTMMRLTGGQDPSPRPDQRRRGRAPARRLRDRHRRSGSSPTVSGPARTRATVTVDRTDTCSPT